MQKKNDRTLDKWLDAAAHVKLLHCTLLDTICALSHVLPRYEYAPLERAYDSFAHIQDIAERRMLKDHPEVVNSDFQRVFYGDIHGYGEISKKVEEKAREYIEYRYKWAGLIGRWVLDEQRTDENRKGSALGAVYTCSECGNDATPMGYGTDSMWLSPFCPWCGTKMKDFDIDQERCDEIDREISEERNKRFREEIMRAKEEDKVARG